MGCSPLHHCVVPLPRYAGEEKSASLAPRLNFKSLMASKFCTPPPTRLVV